MSRISTLEQMMMAAQPKRKFEFDKLSTIPIACLFSSADIDELIQIATSIRYNANINKKYELIDQVMRRRGFVKAHAGTNRRVYRFLEDPSFVAKVAVDKVGMKDSPQEYIHQVKFQPFCCKIFEVHPSGVIAFVEKVNPITSLEEMLSIADDVFDLMTTKILGKYVIDDLGTKTYMNFGVRPNFGPVIIDFPYVYELDSKKLICHNKVLDQFGTEKICGGDIDVIAGFNGYKCLKCGREYKAIDLAKTTMQNFNPFEWDQTINDHLKRIIAHFRSKVIDMSNGKIVLDSGYKSELYLSKEECDIMMSYDLPAGVVEVGKTIHEKRIPAQEMRLQYFSELQRKAMEEQLSVNKPTIRDIMEDGKDDLVEVGRVIKSPEFDPKRYDTPKPLVDDFNSVDGSTFQDVDVDTQVSDDVILENSESETKSNSTIEKQNVESEASIVSAESTSVDIKPASKPIPGQVYSDEQVQAMANANAARNVEAEDGSSGDQAILDPKQDKEHPEISPMTRPYANANESVNVTAKMEAKHKTVEAPKINMDSLISSKEESENIPEEDDEDIESELTDQDITETEKEMLKEAEEDEDETSSEDSVEEEAEVQKENLEPEPNIPDVTITDPESDKAYRKGDYNHRKKNAKRRNPYDD